MSLKLPRNWDLTTLRGESAKIARSKSVIPGDGGAGTGRSDVKRSMEKPMKKGWLKKQRSIVKNWKPCYFVLRGSVLTYHKDERESAVQGTIPLWASQVHELPSNTDDKFIFEIIPRSNGDRERDGYVLMASSQMFGKCLADIIVYEKKLGPRSVPILVEKCAEFIKEHGLDEEGIFRLPGQENQVKNFREAFDAGERPSFPDDTDVHTVASLLKLYLRELPEPVIPWTQYQDFLDSSVALDATTAAGKEKLEKQISLLPKVNYNLLSYICRFLFEVQQHSKVNKMSVENLATVMGVNLFKPQVEDAFSMMKGTPMIQKVMTVMIRHHMLLFPPSKDATPSPSPAPKKPKSKKKANPRNFVGWESAECEMSSLSESPEDEEGDAFETEKSSSKVASSSSSSTSPPPFDVLNTSPRKRTQTLPSLGGAPGFRTSRGPSNERWSYLQETFEEKDEKRRFLRTSSRFLDLQKVTLFPDRQNSNSDDERKDGMQDRRSSNGEAKPTESLQDEVEPQAKPKENLNQSLQPLRRLEVVKLQPQAVTQKHGDNTINQQQLITSLQQRNKELSAAVAKLQSELENEQRSKASLENSLRIAERRRDEALRRNKQLELELQACMRKPM
ncbi:Rho GTPase-activating protein 25 [Bagarius yarrelli]|uniref:Rho GTPase-activating protein 25 n=1 Tax=Bagarius yarrelli TaxID=175774 RepID=A0A556VWK5_BAGYA|nr:Rho GTPase-activating protein 25 [Bagarius yarrelli]